MSIKKTLGGNRLGSGKKMTIDLHNYERSTHDLSYLWRNTQAPGTLVPFLSEVALPGDTFDINLNASVLTHPTIAPLFGSFKLQLDVFQAPIRLYNSWLHNNKLKIGLNMAQVMLPQVNLYAPATPDNIPDDNDNWQINPSHLYAYLGIRGIGLANSTAPIPGQRKFNALNILAYWDIYKNYYANKQEEIGAYIHIPLNLVNETITSMSLTQNGSNYTINEGINTSTVPPITNYNYIAVAYTGLKPLAKDIIIYYIGGKTTLENIKLEEADYTGYYTVVLNNTKFPSIIITGWDYNTAQNDNLKPIVQTFFLDNIDQMREQILASDGGTAFQIDEAGLEPYNTVSTPVEVTAGMAYPTLSPQEGLALKTYQSDLFNNWLQTEWIDGTGGISEVTAIDTSGGSFTIDTLNLSKKVYMMLNRIAVSGGSFDDWIDAVYVNERTLRTESPIYHGGMMQEVVFQEVISNAGFQGSDVTQPLGTLAGRGTLHSNKKGGKITIKVDEPSYIIGIVSLTPRIDYSQGNKWDTHLETMDDLHKPQLDEIGFQELIEEQMHWITTAQQNTGLWTQTSAGKQPAWINYMTNVNTVRGNFAIANNEMFMTLNRKYETNFGQITDMTTYIDPVKYNSVFAQTSLDAMNFWVQIAVNMEARRIMSARLMPNL